jgi:hypothetical protein
VKTGILGLFIIGLLLFGCKKDKNIYGPTANAKGLGLYWDHEVFGKEGRVLRFEFSETRQYKKEYKLLFDYTIEGNDIIVVLRDKISKGKCKSYPMPIINGKEGYCTSRGRMYIPDILLLNSNYKTYNFILKTANFEVKSELIIKPEKFILNVPANDDFICRRNEVFPIPKDLLFGSVVFTGIQNTSDALAYFDSLKSIGLIETTVPNYPYRYLRVDDFGKQIDKHWPEDNHSLTFLYKMDIPFKDIVELSQNYFDKTDLNIYLYSGMGDQAFFSIHNGITIFYAGQ